MFGWDTNRVASYSWQTASLVMAEYDLPTGPAELFEAVRRPLAHAFGGEETSASAEAREPKRFS